MRNLLRELLKYFTKCEDELNNTLIDELLKIGLEQNLNQSETNIDQSSLNPDSLTILTRVHFTPDFSDFLNVVDNTTTSLDTTDLSLDLKNELGSCLERLKADANAVLAMTINPRPIVTSADNKNNDNKLLQDKINSLARQLKSENQMRNDLSDYVKNLESERDCLDKEIENLLAKQKVLENDLDKARERIANLIECAHKEIVSEGFGENKSVTTRSLSKKLA